MVVDMDYFYAQCEELRNPSLKDKPVVVCMYSDRTLESGAVATCNYVARENGVRSGIPIFKAKELLRGKPWVFIRPDFAYYEAMSKNIIDLLREHCDRLRVESIDEAYLDVTSRTQGDLQRAEDLAKHIKSSMLEKLGFRCTIGIGPNKLTAKMACDLCKPDGLLAVREGEFLMRFGHLPVGRLYGVGGRTSAKLNEMGVKTIEDLAKKEAHVLQKAFGRRLGLYFHLASQGLEDEPLVEWRREQVGRMATLKEDSRDIEAIRESLTAMAEEISSELEASGLNYRAVGIVAVDTSLKQHSRSKTLKTEEEGSEPMVKVGVELFKELLDGEPSLVVRRVGIHVSSLKSKAGQTELTRFY
jgi:DNA polymerase IV (DinB-like DNA polymerase)